LSEKRNNTKHIRKEKPSDRLLFLQKNITRKPLFALAFWRAGEYNKSARKKKERHADRRVSKTAFVCFRKFLHRSA